MSAQPDQPAPSIFSAKSDQPAPSIYSANPGQATPSIRSATSEKSHKSVRSDSSSSTARLIHYGSDLFSYDQRTCANQILIGGESAYSKVEYDEYVVYSRPSEDDYRAPARGRRKRRHSETHVTHRFSQDDTSGAKMLDRAFRHDFTLDRNVCFIPTFKSHPVLACSSTIQPRKYIPLTVIT